MRAIHDLGGVPERLDEKIDRSEHELTHFDKSVDALMYLLSHPSRRILRVDELRRAIEQLTPEQYTDLRYYEKWLQAIHDLLIEKDVLDAEEIMLKVAEIRAKQAGAS